MLCKGIVGPHGSEIEEDSLLSCNVM